MRMAINRRKAKRNAEFVGIMVISFFALMVFFHLTQPHLTRIKVVGLSAVIVAIMLVLTWIFVGAIRKTCVAPAEKPANSGGNNQ